MGLEHFHFEDVGWFARNTKPGLDLSVDMGQAIKIKDIAVLRVMGHTVDPKGKDPTIHRTLWTPAVGLEGIGPEEEHPFADRRLYAVKGFDLRVGVLLLKNGITRVLLQAPGTRIDREDLRI